MKQIIERVDGRALDELRPIEIVPHFLEKPPGSVLIRWGGTQVLISVWLERRVPPFLQGSGQGWLTADYTLLTRYDAEFGARGGERFNRSNRAVEIRRFIARSLRGALKLDEIGEMTFLVDCDVLEADGGTRVASVTGGFVALVLACEKLMNQDVLSTFPIKTCVAGVSLGWIRQVWYVDLNYFEDVQADVDLNLVMTASQDIIELQMTGEHAPLPVDELSHGLALGQSALKTIFELQYSTLTRELDSTFIETYLNRWTSVFQQS